MISFLFIKKKPNSIMYKYTPGGSERNLYQEVTELQMKMEMLFSEVARLKEKNWELEKQAREAPARQRAAAEAANTPLDENLKLVLLSMTVDEFPELTAAVRRASGRQVDVATIDNLEAGNNVVVVLYPSTNRSPGAPYIQGQLNKIIEKTGSPPLLLLGHWSQLEDGKYETWNALDYLNKGTYRGPVLFWYEWQKTRFLKWMDKSGDEFNTLLANPKRMQVRSALSFDPTPTDFKLGKKF